MTDEKPYTPSLAEVRERYAQGASAFKPARSYVGAHAEFNRLIAQVRAEAWDEGWNAGVLKNYYGEEANPYRKEQSDDR